MTSLSLDILERSLLYLVIAVSEFSLALVLIPRLAAKRGTAMVPEQVVWAALWVTMLMSTLQVLLIELGIMR